MERRALEPPERAAVVTTGRVPAPVRRSALEVGAVDDPAEREADRIAADVLRSLTDPTVRPAT